jgi:hypothetical protein
VIDQAVADGSVDIGVHSLKDQPVQLPDGVQLAACLPRDDPRCARLKKWMTFITCYAHATIIFAAMVLWHMTVVHARCRVTQQLCHHLVLSCVSVRCTFLHPSTMQTLLNAGWSPCHQTP